MAQRKHFGYISFIRIVAAMAVLFLHANGCFWRFSGTEPYWPGANVIESLFYFAVPLFYMVSAATLLDFYDRDTLGRFFAKRLIRVVLPFVAWSLIGVVEKLLLRQISPAGISLKYIGQGILNANIVSIYWFFTPLFMIYLSLPLFAAVEKSRRRQVFTYLAVVGFVLNQLVPFLKSLHPTDWDIPYSLSTVSWALIWLPVGWLLHNCALKRWHKAVIYVLALLGLALHMGGTYRLSMSAGQVVSTYKGYQNVPSFLYAIGVFVLLKDVGERLMAGRAARFINWLAGYSFPLYLMQFILLDTLPMLPFVNDTSLTYRLLAPFVMAAIIIAVTWCLRKIPGLRRIVP